MLYDNTLIARTYLHAWQVTGDPRFLGVVDSTIAYVTTDLSHPNSSYSAEDADSLSHPGADHAEEGRECCVWTPAQVAAVLGEAGLGEHVDAVCEWFDVTERQLEEAFPIPTRLHAPGPRTVHRRSRQRRPRCSAQHDRPRPGLDDKVLTEWTA